MLALVALWYVYQGPRYELPSNPRDIGLLIFVAIMLIPLRRLLGQTRAKKLEIQQIHAREGYMARSRLRSELLKIERTKKAIILTIFLFLPVLYIVGSLLIPRVIRLLG